jgi:hypothetical protein
MMGKVMVSVTVLSIKTGFRRQEPELFLLHLSKKSAIAQLKGLRRGTFNTGNFASLDF